METQCNYTDQPIIVNRFNPVGRQNFVLPVPQKFLPDGRGTWGMRNNLAFESLTATPDRRYLFTATENALYQDGSQTTQFIAIAVEQLPAP